MKIISTLYDKVNKGVLTQKQFLTEIRKQPSVKKYFSPNHTYDQVITAFKNNNIIPRTEFKKQSQFDVRQFITESNKNMSLTRDQVLEHQYKMGMEKEMVKCKDLYKAESVVLRNLTNNPIYYTEQITGEHVAGANDFLTQLNESLSNMTPSPVTPVSTPNPTNSKDSFKKSLYEMIKRHINELKGLHEDVMQSPETFVGKPFMGGQIEKVVSQGPETAVIYNVAGKRDYIRCFSGENIEKLIGNGKTFYTSSGSKDSFLPISGQDAALLSALMKSINANTRINPSSFNVTQ